MTSSPASSIHGIEHVALTVPDMQEALRLFVDVLGAEVTARISLDGQLSPTGPQSSLRSDRFGRHPETRPLEIVMVRLGTTTLELFEFFAPDQRREIPRWSDLGSYHLALRVTDIPSIATALEQAGVELLDDVDALPPRHVLFARARWGLVLELVDYEASRSILRPAPEHLVTSASDASRGPLPESSSGLVDSSNPGGMLAMKRKSIEVPGLHHGGNPIPVACVVGNLLVSGGISGMDPATGTVPSDLASQVALLFDNVDRVMLASGASLDRIAKMTFFFADPTAREIINEHWIRRFPDSASRPARHSLTYELRPPMLVQCEVIAVLEDEG
jgi:2-iminobutanoate/2-iminopropanoate deaminase